MSISKVLGHMRSTKLNFSATVLTLGLKAKIFGNLRLYKAKVLAGHAPVRTCPGFDRCVRTKSLLLCRKGIWDENRGAQRHVGRRRTHNSLC